MKIFIGEIAVFHEVLMRKEKEGEWALSPKRRVDMLSIRRALRFICRASW